MIVSKATVVVAVAGGWRTRPQAELSQEDLHVSKFNTRYVLFIIYILIIYYY